MTDCEQVIRILDKRYPQKGDMDLGNPKDTLLGVLLSARTRDSQVLKIFPAFRKRYPTFASLAKSSPEEIATFISTIGLYKAKAKAIYALANIIQKKHRGQVPSTMELLCELPGVGRKTANCVLAYVFGEDTVCVDTHVFRIAHRLGWSRGKTPEAVERDIQALLPKRIWKIVNRTFVRFGREICVPGTPKCDICPVRQWCEYGQRRKRDTGFGGTGFE
jgi:endonuclease-3